LPLYSAAPELVRENILAGFYYSSVPLRLEDGVIWLVVDLDGGKSSKRLRWTGGGEFQVDGQILHM
jgi:hypothetical protein